MDSALNVPKILRQYGIRPNKRLGQHFLADARVLERIAEAAEAGPEDTVLEIGAGIGNLTLYLARIAGRVYAVEVDERLLLPLRHLTEPYPNVQVIPADILRLNLHDLVPKHGYIAVGNLPYVITSPILTKLLQEGPQPRRLVVLVQKEVALRMTAGAGAMNLLGLMVQLYGRPEMLFTVPAWMFVPRPEVASALVRMDVYPQPRLPEEDIPAFLHLARTAFRQKRKQLANTLASLVEGGKERVARVLEDIGVSSQARPEDLDIEAWLNLFRRLHSPQ